jgi:pyruvate-formate lyase
LTGLPDAYGRGRIIGDYRRVALYGVDRLIADKKREKATLDSTPSTEDVIRDREELAEQTRALEELKAMAKSYGFDIAGPARTAREAVQWLYFGYLAAVKEQNGAAMSLGRCSTFLDVYFERDLRPGRLTESRRKRSSTTSSSSCGSCGFLRTPEYDELFAGDPTWVTESIGGMGDDGRSLVTKTSFRHAPDALQPRARRRAEPHDLVLAAASRRLPSFAAQVAIDTSSLQFESDEIMRRTWGDDGASPAASRRCWSGSRCSSSARARTSPSACSTRSTAARRDERQANRSGFEAGRRRVPRLRGRRRAIRRDDGQARGRVRERHERHPLHARQVCLRADRDGAARLRARPHEWRSGWPASRSLPTASRRSSTPR